MLNDELDDLRGRLDEREETIVMLETKLQEKEAHIADLQQHITELIKENADLWRRV